MLGLGSNISKTGKLGVHDLGIVTSDLVLKHNYDLSSVQPLSDGAASFNGTSDYIAINAKPVDTADGTYCWWSNSTQVSNQCIFSHGSNKTGAFHGNFIETGKPLLYLHSDLYQYWADTGFADDGKWHHWALVIDVSSMSSCKLYCDGVEVAQGARATTGAITSYSNMEIGRYAAVEFDGYMCNFGVWSSHLSQAQIKSIMNKNYAGLTASEKTDLVSWWNLDSVIPDTTTLVYDNHHGGEGEVLGGELLNCNSFNCADPAALWNEGSGWSFSGGKAIYDGTGGTSPLAQSDVIEVGKTYRVSIEVLSNEGTGPNTIFLGGTVLSAVNLSVGTHVFYGATNNTSVILTIYGRSGEVFEIGSVSVKEINGNTGTLS